MWNDVARHVGTMSRDITSVPPAGIEPATHGLGNRCSSPLSYEGRGRAKQKSRSETWKKTSSGRHGTLRYGGHGRWLDEHGRWLDEFASRTRAGAQGACLPTAAGRWGTSGGRGRWRRAQGRLVPALAREVQGHRVHHEGVPEEV